MNQQNFTRWIENIFNTQEHEIDCNQLQGYLPAFVEAEFGDNTVPHSSIVELHLQQCPDCREIYEGLRLVYSTDLEDIHLDTADTETAEYTPLPATD